MLSISENYYYYYYYYYYSHLFNHGSLSGHVCFSKGRAHIRFIIIKIWNIKLSKKYSCTEIYTIYINVYIVNLNDLPAQIHKPSTNVLKKSIEISGIFIIGIFSIKIWFHETAPL